MKPIKTIYTNQTFKLIGGTEENDLPVVRILEPNNQVVHTSTWELADEERAAIAAGANIELRVWGNGHPPVSLAVN